MGGNPLGMLKISSYFFCNWSNSGQSSFTNSIRTIYHSALGIPIALKSIRNTWSLGCHVLTNIFNYTSICDKNGSPFKITLVSPTEKVTINSFQSTSIALVYIATTYPEPYPSCQAPRVGSLPRWLSLEDPPWPRAHSFPLYCLLWSHDDPIFGCFQHCDVGFWQAQGTWNFGLPQNLHLWWFCDPSSFPLFWTSRVSWAPLLSLMTVWPPGSNPSSLFLWLRLPSHQPLCRDGVLYSYNSVPYWMICCTNNRGLCLFELAVRNSSTYKRVFLAD